MNLDYNNIIYRMREDVTMLRKDKDALKMKNSYLTTNIKTETNYLRKENVILNNEITHLKLMCNQLCEKSNKTEQMLYELNNTIIQMRDFQSQDYVARQELEKQFNNNSKIFEELSSQNLENFAIQNAVSFLSTI
tara:strand:- start:1896 stop:2300 length:405 start_codon:yes stop_codon:yes gene_type:complete